MFKLAKIDFEVFLRFVIFVVIEECENYEDAGVNPLISWKCVTLLLMCIAAISIFGTP